MKLVGAKCTSCGSTHKFVNQSLDDVRAKVCERCGIKLTVTASVGELDPPPMPDRERRILTERETSEARRLLVDAFGKG